jgi:choline dehydrogenase
VRYDVVVVGGGTAGCVLAAKLSESPGRSVCLLEAGPDYGPQASGAWPPDLLDPSEIAPSHVWGPSTPGGRTLGGRVVGGSSAVNACMIVSGTAADYDEWGGGWSHARLAAALEEARSAFRTNTRLTDEAGPFHRAFVDASAASGFDRPNDLDDPLGPIGVGSYPANVVEGRRWSAAAAFLDPARGRPNLEVVPDTLVDRVLLEGERAFGVVDADGTRIDAGAVVLAAGAYFTPAILLRSGIGPRAQLEALGIACVRDLPVGEGLADHCGATVAWEPSDMLREDCVRRARAGTLLPAHTLLKAASSSCPAGTWDLHLVPWLAHDREAGSFEATIMVFHMKPASRGRVSLRSLDPAEPPLVEAGFLALADDLRVVVEGVELARRIAGTEPLRGSLGHELRPGGRPVDEYVRDMARGYFHPVGTCALGTVVDGRGQVMGLEALFVGDASLMPTIPRANTNLTTAAVAARVAAGMDG